MEGYKAQQIRDVSAEVNMRRQDLSAELQEVLHFAEQIGQLEMHIDYPKLKQGTATSCKSNRNQTSAATLEGCMHMHVPKSHNAVLLTQDQHKQQYALLQDLRWFETQYWNRGMHAHSTPPLLATATCLQR